MTITSMTIEQLKEQGYTFRISGGTYSVTCWNESSLSLRDDGVHALTYVSMGLRASKSLKIIWDEYPPWPMRVILKGRMELSYQRGYGRPSYGRPKSIKSVTDECIKAATVDFMKRRLLGAT